MFRKKNKALPFVQPDKNTCLDLIKTGSLKWNQMKEDNPEFVFDLEGLDFGITDLYGINLKNCSLKKANLSKVTNLQEKNLSRSNLDGATLPDKYDFTGLETVKELSLGSSRIFIMIILLCFYCWLTIFSTNDLYLLTNSSSSKLPILDVSLDIIGFYIAAPLILLAFYIYFQLNLGKLWFEFSQLPAFFPDGKSLDQKSYSWLINDLIISYIKPLKDRNGLLLDVQNLLIKILIWWIAPLTIAGIWAECLINHDVLLSSYHSLLLSTCSVFGVVFRHSTIKTLQGKPQKNSKLNDSLIFVLILILTVFLTIIAKINSENYLYTDKYRNKNYVGVHYKFDDMTEIVKKPDNWNQIEKELNSLPPLDVFAKFDSENYKRINRTLGKIKIINLRKKNLFGMEAIQAFFVNADLSNTNLQTARLTGSYFQHARLENTDFKFAGLAGANFQSAYILGANFRNTFIVGANFKNALGGADFTEAMLSYSDFSNSYIPGAKFNNARVDDVNFTSSNLDRASFTNAFLYNTNFKDATLYNTDFSKTDLSHTEGLTYESMENVIIDEETILPKHLSKYRKRLLEQAKKYKVFED